MNSMPAVLVTGAQGFIGRAVVRKLLDNDHYVRILTRRREQVSIELGRQVDIWEGDLTSPSTLSGIAKNVDIVYHLAGEIREPPYFDAVNRLGTEYLLAECQSQGAGRFLYLSSVGVMGARGEAVTLDETSLAHPGNAYEVSKLAGEQTALAFHDPNGMQVMALRPSIVYGEGRSPSKR